MFIISNTFKSLSLICFIHLNFIFLWFKTLLPFFQREQQEGSDFHSFSANKMKVLAIIKNICDFGKYSKNLKIFQEILLKYCPQLWWLHFLVAFSCSCLSCTKILQNKMLMTIHSLVISGQILPSSLRLTSISFCKSLSHLNG